MFNNVTILRKFNAAALYYALTVSIVISTILLATVLLAYYSNYNINQDIVKQKLLLNAYSGIQLATDNNISYDNGLVVDIYGLENDSVFILSKKWGLYNIIISKAFHKNITLTKIAFTGKIPNSNKNTSLYITDKNEPLVITGETKITGDCFLPKSGIKRGYIEGKHYSGEKLTDGRVFESGLTLPSIRNSYLADLKKQFNSVSTEQDSAVYTEEFVFSEKIERSFGNSTVLLLPKNIINIASGSVLNGNIIVLSRFPINISADATIDDVIFYAPVINIESNFSGSTQLFATDSITIERNCTLHYPTSIALINSDNKTVDKSYIKLSEGTIIKGNVFVEKSNSISINKVPSLIIEKNTTINGWVYVNGKVHHSGNIQGHLFCEGFLLRTSSSLYENHLADAEINCKKISEKFIYSYLISDTYKTEIVKWLY